MGKIRRLDEKHTDCCTPDLDLLAKAVTSLGEESS